MYRAAGNRSESHENSVPGHFNSGAHLPCARITQPDVGRFAPILTSSVPDLNVQAEQSSFISGAERRAQPVGTFTKHANYSPVPLGIDCIPIL